MGGRVGGDHDGNGERRSALAWLWLRLWLVLHSRFDRSNPIAPSRNMKAAIVAKFAARSCPPGCGWQHFHSSALLESPPSPHCNTTISHYSPSAIAVGPRSTFYDSRPPRHHTTTTAMRHRYAHTYTREWRRADE